MLFQAEAAALGAALCWSIAGVISLGPARALGALRFNRLRMLIVLAMLLVIVTGSGGWGGLNADVLAVLMLSGVIGISIGDTALFGALRRLGPRRSALVFATSAPIAALFGFVFLGESLRSQTLFGCLLVFAGVVMAILFGQRRDAVVHSMEQVDGSLVHGVALGLFAAACQAVGAIIAKPALETGIDPFAASAVRVAVAAGLLWAAALVPRLRPATAVVIDRGMLGWIALSGLLGMALGMSLLLFALGEGKVGIVMTLSATPPVLMLPIIWWRTGRAPGAAAWLGALMVVLGTGLILTR